MDKENKDFIANAKAYYQEEFILKIWDTYIQKKHLHFWISDSDEKRPSLFSYLKGMNIAKNAGLLINANEQIYINSEGRSISICGPVDNIATDAFNGITNDLDFAIKQVQFKLSFIKNHTIIFPYHITAIHWVLGALYINYDGIENLEAILTIYNPLNQGNLEIKQKVLNEIKKIIDHVFEPNIVNINFKNEKVQFTGQQQDESSCGVITAENGKGIIDGQFNEKRKIIYEAGAKSFLEQHLHEVDSDLFNERKKEDKVWKISEVVELYKSEIYKNQNFAINEGADLVKFIRDELQKK